MAENNNDDNLGKSLPKEIEKAVAKINEIRKKQREFSERIEHIKEGYQPSDTIDTSNPPSGNPSSGVVNKSKSKE